MLRYLKLFFKLAKLRIINQMEYRFSFFFLVLGKILQLAFALIFFGVIYLKVDTIAGWSFPQVLMLFAIYNFVDLVASMLFSKNLFWGLPGLIEQGDLDIFLTKPINIQFLVSFNDFDVMELVSLIPALLLLGFSFSILPIQISIISFVAFFIFVITSLIFIYSVSLIIGSLSVWTIRLYVGNLFDSLTKMVRIPGDFYKGVVKFILYYLFPIVVISTVPAKALFGVLDIQYMVFILLFTSILFIISTRFFKYALKKYSSASS